MQAATIKRLERQVEELFAKSKEKNPTERLDESYSQKAEEQRKKTQQDELASTAATQTTAGILDRLVLQADKPAISASG